MWRGKSWRAVYWKTAVSDGAEKGFYGNDLGGVERELTVAELSRTAGSPPSESGVNKPPAIAVTFPAETGSASVQVTTLSSPSYFFESTAFRLFECGRADGAWQEL